MVAGIIKTNRKEKYDTFAINKEKEDKGCFFD